MPYPDISMTSYNYNGIKEYSNVSVCVRVCVCVCEGLSACMRVHIVSMIHLCPAGDPYVCLQIQSPGAHAFEAQQGTLIAFNFN